MSAPKNIKRPLATEAQAIAKNRATPSARALVDARKALLARIKEIAATGKAELIVEMEKDFIQNDLDRYTKANDKEMTGSLNAALLGVAAIEQQLEIVDDPAGYKAIDRGHGLPKNRKQGLPLDEARQSFASHRARLGNYVKYRLEETEKQIIHERRKALGIAEKDYIGHCKFFCVTVTG